MKCYIKYISVIDKSIEAHPIGLSLKLMRKRSKISQDNAATRIGITRNTLSNYERETSEIPFITFIKLINLYNFKILDMYEEPK